MKPGKVGHIRIKTRTVAIGKNLLRDTQSWLKDSRWKQSVSISLETDCRQPGVEFLPGEFQSNGPRKIDLQDGSQFADFQEYLRRWLWEIEDGPDFTLAGGFGKNPFYI